MTKRKADSSEVHGGKDNSKRRREESKRDKGGGVLSQAFHETQTIRRQAKPYQLMVAKIPFEALTPEWENGENRQVDDKHVIDLDEVFEQNLARTSEENYILVSCTSQAMQKYIKEQQQKDSTSQDDGQELRDLDGWLDINQEPLEIMDGQHRVAALRRLVKRKKLPDTELWWTGIIYDKGKSTSTPQNNRGKTKSGSQEAR